MKRILLLTTLTAFTFAQGPEIVVDDLTPEPGI